MSSPNPNSPYNQALGQTLIERSIREKIVLVGVTLTGHSDEETEASLDELSLLIDTAGADEVARLVQRRDVPDHTWYLGKGKVEELRELLRLARQQPDVNAALAKRAACKPSA